MQKRGLRASLATVLMVGLGFATSAYPAVAAVDLSVNYAEIAPNATGEPVVIEAPWGSYEYTFKVTLPSGDYLSPVRPDPLTGTTVNEVTLQDAHGDLVGAFDAAWASDAYGNPIATDYHLSGNELIQAIHYTNQTGFPITLQPIYSSASGTDEADGILAKSGQSSSRGVFKAAQRPKKVKVPGSYRYDPHDTTHLHDYCTRAPDEYPAPGAKNADFRGPCARHDQCYERAGRRELKTQPSRRAGEKSRCDDALALDMYDNCDYYYGSFNPLRYSCRSTATLYWTIVITVGSP